MAKLEFKKDDQRKSRPFKKIEETKIDEPENIFKLNKSVDLKDNELKKNSKMGRPKNNKVYSTIRIQRITADRVNSLQSVLQMDTQDDLVSYALDRLENSLDSNQKTMMEMYLKTYEAKHNRKK